MSSSDWTRFPTDEMTLRLLIEACGINDEIGHSHLQDFLHMGCEPTSVTNVATDEEHPDIDVALEDASVYDQDGPPTFFVEYEPGKEPHSEHTVIISLAEEILRLRGQASRTLLPELAQQLEQAEQRAKREHNALVTIANWPWGELSRTLEESWHALRDHARAALTTPDSPPHTKPAGKDPTPLPPLEWEDI